LICIFHLGGFSANNWQKADSLFDAGNFFLAGIEYERIAYNPSNNIDLTNALLKKGDCLLAQNNFSEAEYSLSRIRFNDLPDSLLYSARYKNAFASYLNSNFQNAESQLIQLQNFIEDSTYIVKSLLLHGLILNELDSFDLAKEKIKQYIIYSYKNENKKQKLEELELMYSLKEIPKFKSEKKAAKLSTFLPGTGQIYAGYFAEGAVSVLFQLAGLGFGVYSFLIKNYITSVIIGYSFFQKFYLGGVNRAEFLVRKRNYLVKRKFNDKAKNYILSMY
jgi:tetratricopeptide (TPR) repeat protein